MNYLVYNNQTLEQSAWCSIPFNEETSGERERDSLGWGVTCRQWVHDDHLHRPLLLRSRHHPHSPLHKVSSRLGSVMSYNIWSLITGFYLFSRIIANKNNERNDGGWSYKQRFTWKFVRLNWGLEQRYKQFVSIIIKYHFLSLKGFVFWKKYFLFNFCQFFLKFSWKVFCSNYWRIQNKTRPERHIVA